MVKNKTKLSEVNFTYVGTDTELNEFLKCLLHDYFCVDNPYTGHKMDSVAKVESPVA